MKVYELNMLMERLDEYISAKIISHTSPHVEDALTLSKAQQHLKDYIEELIGVEED